MNIYTDAPTTEDLQGRLNQVTKLFADKSLAFEDMRKVNLDLVRRLSNAANLQLLLQKRVSKLEWQVTTLTDSNARLGDLHAHEQLMKSELHIKCMRMRQALQDIARQPEGDEQSAQAIANEILREIVI